jgi:hypothetical protein
MNPQQLFFTDFYAGYLEAWSAALGWKIPTESIEDAGRGAEQRWEDEGGAPMPAAERQ